MKTVWIAAAFAFGLSAISVAHASPNPFFGAYHGDVTVTDVSVTYTDGILESHSDRAAQSFVGNENFPAELRAEFEASVATRGLTGETYGERFSEFLVARSLRARTATLTGARRVRLEVDVTDARINGMISGAFFGGAAFPRLSGAVRILDADTGALLATATIRNALSYSQHNDDAARTHGFRYNFSGTDTNLRLLAGSTEAMSGHVGSILSATAFADPDEPVVLMQTPRITIRPPLINVALAAQ